MARLINWRKSKRPSHVLSRKLVIFLNMRNEILNSQRFSFGNSLFYLEELEQHLCFKYLPQIAFESVEERDEIYAKGVAQFQADRVKKEAIELGEKFCKEIEKGWIASTSIRLVSEQVGYGLFAHEFICKDSFVGEYTGIVRKNDRRYTEPLNNYCYEYPVPDHIGRSYVIDATQGNLTRFINHSYQPNLKPVHAFWKGFYHLIFLAVADIKVGEQLSYDYGHRYWHVRSAPQSLESVCARITRSIVR